MVAMMAPCAFAAEEEAEVNGTKYSSLQDAIDNTAEGTITLLNDVELSNQLVFTNGKNITLDLNGHSISRTNNVVMVQNAHLTVTGTGKISETAPDYGAIVIKGSNNENDTNYSVVTVESGVTLEAWAAIFITPFQRQAARACIWLATARLLLTVVL